MTTENATSSPAAAGELDRLREVNARPLPGRWLGYARLSGPGFIQSSITLGASTATSSFYLGYQFGYSMLWVQILGMLMGVVMFSAVARPTLYREQSIYRAMSTYVNPIVAVAWALASIIGSMVWCLNQYSTAVACLEDVGKVAGLVGTEGSTFAKWGIGVVILIVSIPLTWAYGARRAWGVRLYENVLKGVIAFMVVCFAAVAWKTGIQWGELARGLVPKPGAVFDLRGADLTKVLGSLGCAVGINMTFLFPLTLRARGWGKEHLGLARFDLVAGMLVPFAIISSLVVISVANLKTSLPGEPSDPTQVAGLMETLFEGSLGRVLFDLGVAAMPLSTITILMLICGLAVCEMAGLPHRGLWFKIGCLLPVVGIFGVAHENPFWLGPLISSFALPLLPIAYFGFMMLHNSRRFLGDDMPRGTARMAWNALMAVILAVTVAGASLKLADVARTIRSWFA